MSKRFRDFKMKPSICLECGSKLDGATETTSGSSPKPGNLSICLTCGHLAIFADDLTLRELTDQEMYDVAGDPTVIALMKARNHVMKKKQN